MTNLAPSPLEGEGRGEGKQGRYSILCLTPPAFMPVTTETQILRFAQNDRWGENDR